MIHPLYIFFFAVCREWLVHEDGALAYRLQDEESKKIIIFVLIFNFFFFLMSIINKKNLSILIWWYIFFSVKEHYTHNKVRNAQVREDLPKAKVEQELEMLRYQSYVQEQSVLW